MENKFAEIFTPGEFLQDELDARKWTPNNLAEIIGKSPSQINALIKGTTPITPALAAEIGQALGTGADFWMNLQSQYQIAQIAEIAQLTQLRQLSPS